MRKLLCIFLAVLLLALCGCSQASQGTEVIRNDNYAIRQDGDTFFLTFHDGSYEEEYRRQMENSTMSGVRVGRPISFSSVAEMKEGIKKGDFTKQQLVTMQSFERSSNGNVALCNLNNLYDIKLPNDVRLTAVRWYGKTYSFSFSAEDPSTAYGNVKFATKEYCDETTRKTDLKSEGNASNITVLSETVDPQTNGTVTRYFYFDGVKQQIMYTYTNGESTVTVEEMYFEEEGLDELVYVAFWGNCGDQYFEGCIYGLTERPDYEWITSFGLTPYVEKEVS